MVEVRFEFKQPRPVFALVSISLPQLILVLQNTSLCQRNTASSQEGLKIRKGNGWQKKVVFIFSLVAQLVKNPPAMWETYGFDPWVGKIPWRRERLPTPGFWPGWGCGADTTKQLSTTTSFIATWWSKGILWEPVYSVPKVMTEF